MGKASRLRTEAVLSGREDRKRDIWRTCKLCGEIVIEYRGREHIRKCWQYPISDTTPIPSEPIVYRDGKLMPNWKDFVKEGVHVAQ
jgi:hypothetical protein